MSRPPRLPASSDLEILPMVARGLSIDQGAAYAGCRTVSAFRDCVRRGLMRGPVPATHRYDRQAIDGALDQMSRIAPTMPELV
jgi:hypothetical protein